MAGLGRKVFTAGDVLTASDVQNYLMDQTVMNFAGTAARSSAIATPTEGMLTYLADSNALQVYDGAAYVAVGASSGLTLITTVTLSSTSTTVSNCFTSTYTNYLIVSNCATAATTQLDVFYQLRASGVTTTTGYTASILYNNQGAGPLRFYNAQSSWISGYGGNYGIGMTQNIYGPQLAQRTTMTGLSSGFAAGGSQQGFVGGLLDDSTQYDSLVITATNTLSGTLSIYGYSK